MAAEYKARERYQDQGIASNYDEVRFQSWHGRLSHRIEEAGLDAAIKKYFSRPGNILDLPCGTGRLFPVMINQGFDVVGGDISEAMLDCARKKFQGKAGVSLEKMDAENLPYPENHFDYVTSYRLMTHLPRDVRRRVLDEMIRVARKILVLNFHFKVFTPLYVFNRFFRKNNCPAYPVPETEIRREFEERKNVRLLEIRKLSWYERSSALVILEKRPRQGD